MLVAIKKASCSGFWAFNLCFTSMVDEFRKKIPHLLVSFIIHCSDSVWRIEWLFLFLITVFLVALPTLFLHFCIRDWFSGNIVPDGKYYFGRQLVAMIYHRMGSFSFAGARLHSEASWAGYDVSVLITTSRYRLCSNQFFYRKQSRFIYRPIISNSTCKLSNWITVLLFYCVSSAASCVALLSRFGTYLPFDKYYRGAQRHNSNGVFFDRQIVLNTLHP